MREANTANVIALFQEKRRLSRAAVARLTSLNKATVSGIVDDLIKLRLLRAVGFSGSRPGRPAEILEFVPMARLILGLELGPNRLLAIVSDLDGRVQRSISLPSSAQPARALELAQELVDRAIRMVEPGTVMGIGVGVPGAVDPARGTIEDAPDVGWRAVPVKAAMEERFGVPVLVANRAKAAVLAEYWSGAARGCDPLIFVFVSTSIAAGIVVNGELYEGASRHDGDLGHVTILPAGPLCTCGKQGCLEAVAAAPALLADARARLRRGSSDPLAERVLGRPDRQALEVLGEAVASGEEAASAAVETAAGYIGLATANLASVLNPRMVVLGGNVLRVVPSMVERIGEHVRRRASSAVLPALEIVPSTLGEEAVALGAATLLLADHELLARLVSHERVAEARVVAS